jgi:hypothetical protein
MIQRLNAAAELPDVPRLVCGRRTVGARCEDRRIEPTSTTEGAVMDVQFIASVAVISPDPVVSRMLYLDGLGLPLAASEGDDYWHSEEIAGSKHFAIWPLTQAAQACFGTPDWPAERPVPQASVEFEVADADTVQVAADELKDKGFQAAARCADGAVGTGSRAAAIQRGCDHRAVLHTVNAPVAERIASRPDDAARDVRTMPINTTSAADGPLW